MTLLLILLGVSIIIGSMDAIYGSVTNTLTRFATTSVACCLLSIGIIAVVNLIALSSFAGSEIEIIRTECSPLKDGTIGLISNNLVILDENGNTIIIEDYEMDPAVTVPVKVKATRVYKDLWWRFKPDSFSTYIYFIPTTIQIKPIH